MELTIQVASHQEAMALFGMGDRNLKLIRDACSLQITARNGRVRLAGDAGAVVEHGGGDDGRGRGDEYADNRLLSQVVQS